MGRVFLFIALGSFVLNVLSALNSSAALADERSAEGPENDWSAGGPAIERSTGEAGLAVVDRGVTPALRIRARTSAAWAVVCTVTTVPAAPPRAVRPDRCT